MAGGELGSRRIHITTPHHTMSRHSTFPWQPAAFTVVGVVCTIALVAHRAPGFAVDRQLQTSLAASRLFQMQQPQQVLQEAVPAQAAPVQAAPAAMVPAAAPAAPAAPMAPMAQAPMAPMAQAPMAPMAQAPMQPMAQAPMAEGAPIAPQAPPGVEPVATCAAPCTDQFKADSAEISGLTDQIELSQALCTSMQRLFSCQCDRCEPPYEEAVTLQQQLCSLETAVSLHQAGGSCQGFASNFCQTPFSAAFCEARTWVDPAGSPGWINNGHEVADPGDTASTAGADLYASQQPAYAEESATNLVRYLTSGAASEASKAQLRNVIASEIEGFRPVEKEEGLGGLLPFLGEEPSEADKEVLQEDAKLQTEDFGHPLSKSEAHEYGAEIKTAERDIDASAAKLPPDEEKDLNELAMAADKYNAAAVASHAGLPLLLLLSSLLTFLCPRL